MSRHKEIGSKGGAAPHRTRTGWTKGKFRHELVVSSRALHSALDRISASDRRCACARELGVCDRTVRRWIAGEDRPSPEYQMRLVEFSKR